MRRKEGGRKGRKGKKAGSECSQCCCTMSAIPRLAYLCLSCPRLCREVDHKGLIDFFVQAVHQLVLDVHTLASTRGTHKQNSSVVADHDVH